MTTRKLLVTCVIISVGIALPFMRLHMVAKPDDAPISPLQQVAAALANCCGPWGVALVRLVDFPNAGLRSFSWPLAVGLTVVGGLLIALCTRLKNRYLQCAFIACWTLFALVWLSIGFRQIADGLL